MAFVSSSELIISQEISLRELTEADAPIIVDQLNTPEIAEWLAAVPQPFEPDHVSPLLDLAQTEGTALYGIEAGGKLSGCLCLGANTWFWLVPEFWKGGVMTMALHAAIHAYFNRVAAPLYATARLDNHASRALLKKLGFAALPDKRRMFFQSAGTSHQCEDFVLAPEQWHLMHPPRLDIDGATIRPATHKHASDLATFLPNRPPWPKTDLLPFIDKARFRGGFGGLFVIHDDNKQMIGAAVLQPPDMIVSAFVSTEKAERYSDHIERALRQKFG